MYINDIRMLYLLRPRTLLDPPSILQGPPYLRVVHLWRDKWTALSGSLKSTALGGPLSPLGESKATWKRGFKLPWRKAGLLISSR